jgi:hypothetical protein
VVKEIPLPQNPSLPAIELPDVVREQSQVIIVEEAGNSNGLAKYAKYNHFLQVLFFTVDPFEKSEKEKPFQVVFYRCKPGRRQFSSSHNFRGINSSVESTFI